MASIIQPVGKFVAARLITLPVYSRSQSGLYTTRCCLLCGTPKAAQLILDQATLSKFNFVLSLSIFIVPSGRKNLPSSPFMQCVWLTARR